MLLETGATFMECFESLKSIIPIDLAIYTKENDLLELGGWKTLKRLADRSKLTEQLVKQAKLYSLKFSPMYKYGYEVPKNYKDTERLDIKNNKHNWMNANKLEYKQLTEYDVFKDQEPFAGCMIPCGSQLIQVHTTFNIKVDRRQKA